MNGLLKILLVGALAYGGYDQYKKHYAAPDKPVVNWQTVSMDTVNINVMFPKPPKVEQQTVQGMPFEWKGVRHGAADYSLGVMQNLDFSIDDAYPHVLTAKGAKLLDKSFVLINGYEGYEFKMDFGSRQVIQRMIRYHNALVTQTAIYTEQEVEDTARFINSLTL